MAAYLKNCPLFFRATSVSKLLFSIMSLFPSIAGATVLAEQFPASTLLRNKVGCVWVCVCAWVENPIKH